LILAWKLTVATTVRCFWVNSIPALTRRPKPSMTGRYTTICKH